VAVNLSSGTATNVRGGILNIVNVTGGSGADTLTGGAGDNLLLGNAGSDVLNGGAGGNDVLVGGAGNDNLTGSAGRNILIGGLGADVLTGGGGEDILIGGTTNHDATAAALTSLMAEWKRTDLGYQQRIDHLIGATAGGLNGSKYLKSTTVKDDGTADTLTGLEAQDWFWALAAEVTDWVTGERLN
jgi:Ca2+-binding RTX toxin-like protein